MSRLIETRLARLRPAGGGCGVDGDAGAGLCVYDAECLCVLKSCLSFHRGESRVVNKPRV